MPARTTLPDPHRDGYAEADRIVQNTPRPVADTFETIYARTVPVLRYIANVRFRIPLAEAEGLVQDVFMKFAIDYRSVSRPREWLVAAISNTSRNYIRDHQRETPLPDDSCRWVDPNAELAVDSVLTRLAVGATLQRLGDGCRDILYRFHLDGQSTSTIATDLGTTAGYIQLRLHLCRKRARALYQALTKVSA